MKMRKLFAGIAVAATMLGGLALGASAASAAEGDAIKLATGDVASITIKTETTPAGNVNGHTFTAVQLASYDGAVEGAEGKVANVSVDTIDNLNDAITNALISTGATIDGTAYAGNPMGYVARYYLGYTTTDSAMAGNEDTTSATRNYDGKLREFVTALAKETAFTTAVSDAAEQYKATGADDSAMFNKLPQGLYMIVDTTTSGQTGKYTLSIPMLLGTQIYYGDPAAGHDLVNQALGVVNVKNEPVPVIKTVSDASQAIGRPVTWTVKGQVPNWVGKDLNTVQYTFTDTPGLGQTIADLTKLTIKVDGVDDPLTFGTDYRIYINTGVQDAQNVEITVQSEDKAFTADGTKYFIVDLTSWLKTGSQDKKAPALDSSMLDKKITMTYTATINKDALPTSGNVGTIKNDVKVTNDGATNTDSDETKTFNFDFTKVAASDTDKGIPGAEFKIQIKNGKWLKQDIADDTNTKAWSDTDNEEGATVFTSGGDGKVKFEGLAAGTYVVKETKAAPGYFQSVLPSFEVTIAENGTVTFTSDTTWNLVDTENHKVKNVDNLTQLPLTGAAGIAMFTVIGLLVLGAGVLVYVKSRSTRKAMMV